MARSFVIILLTALIALGIRESARSQEPDRERLRVGATMSITGKTYSVQGGYGREGYLLCQKHLNAQGGLLGKTVEFLIYDDESDEKNAARLYEKLITEDKVDAILGPYGTAITEAVADIPDKYRKVMIAANAATSSIWEKGRKYLIMVLAPVDSAAVGALDLAARHGLKNVAIVNQDALLPSAVAKTTNELARSMGLNVVSFETYPTGTSDFSGLLLKVQQSAPDLLVTAAVRIDDLVAMIHQMRAMNFNTKMVSSLPYGLLPEFYELLGKDAEFVYSATFWDGSLPNPGNPEFVSAYHKEFNRAPAVQSANSYAGCQIFAEAVRQAGTTESEKLREALLSLKTKSVLGDFAVDQRGFQIGQKAVTIQWQDGRQAVVWPNGLGSAPRFPTPNWASR